MYVTAQEYEALSLTHAVPEEELESALKAAERDIDSLTFCRIHRCGLDGLTDFQRQNVKQAVVDQADFRAQYGELLDNPLASYSVNGPCRGTKAKSSVFLTWTHPRRSIPSCGAPV